MVRMSGSLTPDDDKTVSHNTIVTANPNNENLKKKSEIVVLSKSLPTLPTIIDEKKQHTVSIKKDNEYDLALMPSLLDNKKENAKNNFIYLSEDGTYIVRDAKGVIREGSLDTKKIDLSRLQEKLTKPDLKLALISALLQDIDISMLRNEIYQKIVEELKESLDKDNKEMINVTINHFIREATELLSCIPQKNSNDKDGKSVVYYERGLPTCMAVLAKESEKLGYMPEKMVHSKLNKKSKKLDKTKNQKTAAAITKKISLSITPIIDEYDAWASKQRPNRVNSITTLSRSSSPNSRNSNSSNSSTSSNEELETLDVVDDSTSPIENEIKKEITEQQAQKINLKGTSVFLPICRGTSEALSGVRLSIALERLLSHGVSEICIFHPQYDNISLPIEQHASKGNDELIKWKQANKDLFEDEKLESFKDKRIKQLTHDEMAKLPSYKLAEEKVNAVLSKDEFRDAIVSDAVSFLRRKSGEKNRLVNKESKEKSKKPNGKKETQMAPNRPTSAEEKNKSSIDKVYAVLDMLSKLVEQAKNTLDTESKNNASSKVYKMVVKAAIDKLINNESDTESTANALYGLVDTGRAQLSDIASYMTTELIKNNATATAESNQANNILTESKLGLFVKRDSAQNSLTNQTSQQNTAETIKYNS